MQTLLFRFTTKHEWEVIIRNLRDNFLAFVFEQFSHSYVSQWILLCKIPSHCSPNPFSLHCHSHRKMELGVFRQFRDHMLYSQTEENFSLLDTIVTIYKMENPDARQEKEAGVLRNLIKQNIDKELKRLWAEKKRYLEGNKLTNLKGAITTTKPVTVEPGKKTKQKNKDWNVQAVQSQNIQDASRERKMLLNGKGVCSSSNRAMSDWGREEYMLR